MKRTGLLRRSKRLRPFSKKREKQLALYYEELKRWYPLHPTCEIGPVLAAAGYKVNCRRVTTHPHHTKGRVGRNLWDSSTWMASCSGECHPQWVHFSHPKEARELGLLK